MKVCETMLINEILDLAPEINEIFLSHGLNCQGCPGSYNESLKEAASGHDINLAGLIEDLNNYLNKS